MKKKASVVIAAVVVGVLWWWNHAPEIKWHEAKLYIGKKVTVVGPVIGGRLDSPDGTVMMIMGIGRIDSPNRNVPYEDVVERNGHTEWESSLHILMPRASLAPGWTQKDLERGTVMKWSGTLQKDLGTTWLNVDGDWQSVARWYKEHPNE